MTQTCPTCGTTFTPTPHARRHKIYCSEKCRKRVNKLRWRAAHRAALLAETRTCPGCGAEFTPARKGQKFCSVTCTKRYYKQMELSRAKAARRAAKAGKKCAWCGKDISHRLASARYCSWQCKNAAGVHARQQRVAARSSTATDVSIERVNAYLALPARARWANRNMLSPAELKLAEKLYTEGHTRTVSYNTLVH